ncbi:MAG: hypothetical protein IVW55_16330 [Chloroflexi bacterium]|nr:hypothetical protein [Chloroflexota bacterium]
MTLLVVQLGDLGLSGTVQLVTQWGFFLLSMLGIFAAIRAGRTPAALLCISFVLVPGLLLGIFKTSNTVFIRYGLFALPFYLLIISNGLLSLWLGLRPVPSPVFKTLRLAAVGLVATTVALFALSVYAYFDPTQYPKLSYYPDYRSAARYLSQTATRADLIIVNDEPALGYPVFDLYWHGKAPAPTFDARDPRLFKQPTTGSLYWVVSFFQNDPSFLGRLAGESAAWKEIAQYDRILILKEDRPVKLSTSMNRMVSKLEEENSRFQPVITLRGALYQASGDAANAAAAYHSAGSYFQSGNEYLLTAQGYAARGDMAAAWREAIISNFMEPDKPEIHAWLAQSLKEANDIQGSLVEDQISRLLRASP